MMKGAGREDSASAIRGAIRTARSQRPPPRSAKWSSRASSTRSAGCRFKSFARACSKIGASEAAAVTRTVPSIPTGAPRRLAAAVRARAGPRTSARKRSPSGVRESDRVVRRNRRAPCAVSKRPTRRATAAAVTPRRRAAPAKEPASATRRTTMAARRESIAYSIHYVFQLQHHLCCPGCSYAPTFHSIRNGER